MLHGASDLNQRTLAGATADVVVLDEPLVWNRAPSVNTMVLPEVRYLTHIFLTPPLCEINSLKISLPSFSPL